MLTINYHAHVNSLIKSLLIYASLAHFHICFQKELLNVSLAMLFKLYIYIYISMNVNAPTFMQHEEPKANDVNDATLKQG